MKSRRFSFAVAVGLLAGCGPTLTELPTLTAAECRTASWYTRGMEMGRNGHRTDAYQWDVQTCQPYGVQPDWIAWRAGWERGVSVSASIRKETMEGPTMAERASPAVITREEAEMRIDSLRRKQFAAARRQAGGGSPPSPGPPAPDDRMSPAARTLLTHLFPGDPEMERAARDLAAGGEEPARKAAELRLVTAAKDIGSNTWRARTRSGLDEITARRGLSPTPAQYEAEIERLRAEQLGAVIAAMAAIGGPRVAAACLDLAADESLPGPIRLSALSVAGRHVDPRDTASRDRGFALWERLAPAPPPSSDAP